MISKEQYQHSLTCRRHLESIRTKTFGDYRADEIDFLESEIRKHIAIIDLYQEQISKSLGSKELLTMLIPVKLTLENYKNLHFNNAVGKLSKFKVAGSGEIVYSDDVIHKVDIDYPLGFFHAGGKIVDSIIIPKSVTVGEFDKIVKRIYDTEKVDINSKTEIFEKAIEYITEMYNKLY